MAGLTAAEFVVAEAEVDLERPDAGVLGPLEAVGALASQAGSERLAFARAVDASGASDGALAFAVLLRLGSREVHRERLDRHVVTLLVGVVRRRGGGGG